MPLFGRSRPIHKHSLFACRQVLGAARLRTSFHHRSQIPSSPPTPAVRGEARSPPPPRRSHFPQAPSTPSVAYAPIALHIFCRPANNFWLICRRGVGQGSVPHNHISHGRLVPVMPGGKPCPKRHPPPSPVRRSFNESGSLKEAGSLGASGNQAWGGCPRSRNQGKTSP